jgi:hypothetical protein
MRALIAPLICGALFVLAQSTLANHGPGASGGGSSTISGETLKPGHFELTLREDFSKFEHFSDTAATGRAQRGGDFDALDHGFVTTADFAIGIAPNFQVGATVGYFNGNDFLSADSPDGNDVELARANPTGLTDVAIVGKYRVLSGEPGNVALVLGVVLPTGRSDVRLANGERLSPTDQPGSGRWGLPIGIGYSRFLTSHITIDASALYTFHFEKDDFKVGDRLDLGLALAYRITESVRDFPQFSLFGELNDVCLQKDRVDGSDDPNSGSNAMYITPGVRVRFNEHAALTVAPSIPIWQEVNGDQGKVDFKLAVALSISF